MIKEEDHAVNPKSTDPIYTLGIASKLSQTPMHSIRQYVDKGLIIPFCTKTGRHLFSEVDVVRLKCIKHHLSAQGLNIAGIKALYALIPCWAIRKCSLDERHDCGAYKSSITACWEASDKSFSCLNTDCRQCEVYRIPENCGDLKNLIKNLLP